MCKCKDAIDILDAIRANDATRIERKLKNLNFGGYSCCVNQSGACFSIESKQRQKAETTMEDKIIIALSQ